MGRKLIDQEQLTDKLWRLMEEDTDKGMQCGLLQAILVATLMDTAETVERGDIPYDETAGV